MMVTNKDIVKQFLKGSNKEYKNTSLLLENHIIWSSGAFPSAVFPLAIKLEDCMVINKFSLDKVTMMHANLLAKGMGYIGIKHLLTNPSKDMIIKPTISILRYIEVGVKNKDDIIAEEL